MHPSADREATVDPPPMLPLFSLHTLLGLRGMPVAGLPIERLHLHPRTHKALLCAGFATIDALCTASNDELRSVRGLGSTSLAEIHSRLRDSWQSLAQQEPAAIRADQTNDPDYPLPATGPTSFEHHYSPGTGLDIQAVLDELIQGKNGELLTQFGVPVDALPVPRTLVMLSALLPSTNGTSTLKDIFATFAQQTSLLALADLRVIRSHLDAYLKTLLLTAVHLFVPAGVTRVTSSELRLSDIMVLLLLGLDSRQIYVLCARPGLRDGTCHTLHETAEPWGLTRERVRQIESKGLARIHTNTLCTMTQIQSALRALLHPLLAERGGIATMGELVAGLEAAGWVGPVAASQSLRFLLNQTNVLTVLCDGLYALPDLNLQEVSVPSLQSSIIERLKGEHTQMSIPALAVELESTLPVATPLSPQRLVEVAILNYPQLVLDKNGLVGLARWQWTWLDELIKALRAYGRPAHFSRAAAPNALLPSDQQVTEHTVHGMLQRRTDLFARCGPGTYGLLEWGLVHQRSITDTAYYILQAGGQPLTAHRLTERVLEYQRVSPTSVPIMVSGDPRFRRIGQRFALREWPGDYDTATTAGAALTADASTQRQSDVESILDLLVGDIVDNGRSSPYTRQGPHDDSGLPATDTSDIRSDYRVEES